MALVQSRVEGLLYAPVIHGIDKESNIGARELRRLSRGAVKDLLPNEDYLAWGYIGSVEIIPRQQQQEEPKDVQGGGAASDNETQQHEQPPSLQRKQKLSSTDLDVLDARMRSVDHVEETIRQLRTEFSLEQERVRKEMERLKLEQERIRAVEQERVRADFGLEQERMRKEMERLKLEQERIRAVEQEWVRADFGLEQERMRKEMERLKLEQERIRADFGLEQERMRKEVERLKVRVDEMALPCADGEWMFVCDVLHNVPLKLSYALQAAVAAELQGKHLDFKLDFLQDISESDIYALTYGSILAQLLGVQDLTSSEYITMLRDGGTEQQQRWDRVDERTRKLKRLLKKAEVKVAAELGVPAQHLQITAAVYLFQMKPWRNEAAHRNQLHPLTYWRKCSNAAGVNLDPAPNYAILKCLEGAPVNTTVELPPVQVICALQMLGSLETRLRSVVGEWIYEKFSLDVVHAIVNVLFNRFQDLVSEAFRGYLKDTGHVPGCFHGLTAVSDSDNSGWTGWIIFLSAQPGHRVWLSTDGQWMERIWV